MHALQVTWADVSELELDALLARLGEEGGEAAPCAADALAERLHQGVIGARLAESCGKHTRWQPDRRDDAPDAEFPFGWYVAEGDSPKGPLSVAEVRERWDLGAIGPDTLCWRPGFLAWVALCRIPELVALLAPPAVLQVGQVEGFHPLAAAAFALETGAWAPPAVPEPSVPEELPAIVWRPHVVVERRPPPRLSWSLAAGAFTGSLISGLLVGALGLSWSTRALATAAPPVAIAAPAPTVIAAPPVAPEAEVVASPPQAAVRPRVRTPRREAPAPAPAPVALAPAEQVTEMAFETAGEVIRSPAAERLAAIDQAFSAEFDEDTAASEP